MQIKRATASWQCTGNPVWSLLQLIGGDPDKDIAVLQLQCPEEKWKELKPVELGTSANLLVGQKVFAIGNPFG